MCVGLFCLFVCLGFFLFVCGKILNFFVSDEDEEDEEETVNETRKRKKNDDPGAESKKQKLDNSTSEGKRLT